MDSNSDSSDIGSFEDDLGEILENLEIKGAEYEEAKLINIGDSLDIGNIGEDLEKIFKNLDIASVDSEIDIVKVEGDMENVLIESSRIDELEGIMISIESRTHSIEKEGIELSPKLESVEKHAKIQENKCDELSNQIKSEQLARKSIEDRVTNLEKSRNEIKDKFFSLLELCEGFQGELEQLKLENVEMTEMIVKDEKFPDSCSPPTQMLSNVNMTSPSVEMLSNINAAMISPSVSLSTANQSNHFVSPPPSSIKLPQISLNDSIPVFSKPVVSAHSKHHHPLISRGPLHNLPPTSHVTGVATGSITKWNYPLEQQVGFGPIPGHLDHDDTYIFLRTVFKSLGHVCHMFLSQAVERDQVSGKIVKFGYVVFQDKTVALMVTNMFNMGEISLPGGIQVALNQKALNLP